MSKQRSPELDERALERAGAAMYGKGWDGPPEKQPGPEMKAVWIKLARKAVTGYLDELDHLHTPAKER